MELEATAAAKRVKASAPAAAAAAERVEATGEDELEVASLEWVAAALLRLRFGVQRVHTLIVLPPLVGISQHLHNRASGLINEDACVFIEQSTARWMQSLSENTVRVPLWQPQCR